MNNHEKNIFGSMELPVNWKLLPNRALFKERIERGFDDKNLLSVTIEKGIIPQEELIDTTSKKDSSNEDKSNYKLVRKNDIAYNKMRMWQGAVGYSDYEGIVSPAYVILKPIEDINSRYYHYLFRTNLYNVYSYTYSYGISNDTLSLRWDEFKRMLSIILPRKGQDAIVKFLEERLTDIAQYISIKQKQIELLNEQKAAIINQVVTKGLDPTAKMKNSGVEWLGDVPEDWKIKRLKYFVNDVNSIVNQKSEDEIYFALENIESWTGRIIPSEEIVQFESNVKCFSPDNILFGKLRPYLAKVVYVDFKGVCVGEFLVLRKIEKNLYMPYLENMLRSHKLINYINSSTYGARMPRANWNFIGNIKIALPQTIEEQKSIHLWIKDKIKVIDEKRELLDLSIRKINDYKNSLISEAVTGKIKVI